MMKSKSGPKAWTIYIAVRSLLALMQVFPIEWNLLSARSFVWVWRVIMPRHFRRAVDHITMAYGDSLSSKQIKQMAHRSLESTTMFAVETICMPRLLTPFSWSRYIQTENVDEGMEAMISGKGAIMVTGHYGSFELSGHIAGCLGLDIVAIMRPLDNVYLNRMLVQSRRHRGMEVVDKKGAALVAEDMLREGKLLAFIGDQDAGKKGVFVDFFGTPASTYKSIGLLAMTTDSPIIVSYARRCGNNARYVVGMNRVIHPHEWKAQDDPLRWITQTYTRAIEDFVRVEPSQYLWIHRRWKHKPRKRRVKPDPTPTVKSVQQITS